MIKLPKEATDVLETLGAEGIKEIASVLEAIFAGDGEVAAQRARIAAESEAITRSAEAAFAAGKAARGKLTGKPIVR